MSATFDSDLRHHAARRRAIARRQHEPERKTGNRPGAGRPGRRRHRGRLSDRLARRFRGGAADRPNDTRAGDLRAGPLPRGRHRPGLGSFEACPVAADSYLSGHQRHPSRIQAEDDQGGDHRPGRGRRGSRGGAVRQHRVFARGCRPHRNRFSLPGGRGRHCRRGRHGEHSRHGRLCHACPHGPRDPLRCASGCPTSIGP